MRAIVECKVPLLDNLKFLQTEACCKAAAEGFQSIRYNQLKQEAFDAYSSHQPSTFPGRNGAPVDTNESFSKYPFLRGNSTTRLRIVRRVTSLGLQRPCKSVLSHRRT